MSLLIIDNGHCLLTSQEGRCTLNSFPSFRHTTSRLIVFTTGLVENAEMKLHHLDNFFPCKPEASCELLSLLRFIANPK